jgi:hypothetical protein
MKTLLTIAAALVTLTSVTAQAATFTLSPNTCNNKEEGCTFVSIEGSIEPNDGGRFMELMLKAKPKKVLVGLHSDGGNLVASLQIGRFIRANNYATIVTSNSVCVSGCAMIWLAGSFKQVSETAKIGFHAAYTITKVGKQPYATESGQGNAVVGAYYSELGYSEDAIRFFTMAPPNSATWLSTEKADRLGIKVKVYAPEKKS